MTVSGFDIFACQRDHCAPLVAMLNGSGSDACICTLWLQMRSRSMAKSLTGTVKEMLGTAFSVGCTVNGKSPKDLCEDIDEGTVSIPEK